MQMYYVCTARSAITLTITLLRDKQKSNRLINEEWLNKLTKQVYYFIIESKR